MNSNLTNELDEVWVESKDLIHRYESKDPQNIDKIKIIYQSLADRYDVMKNMNQINHEEYISLISDFKILTNDLILKIQQLEQHSNLLEQRLRVLENKESERDTKTLINKYMIAIQDYNARYGIEKSIEKDNKTEFSQEAKNSLSKLRKNRNGQCHYCSKFCNDKEAAQRFSVMIQRIRAMDPKVKYVIDRRYPGLLDAIIMTKNKNNRMKKFEEITNQDVDQINEWWDDLI